MTCKTAISHYFFIQQSSFDTGKALIYYVFAYCKGITFSGCPFVQTDIVTTTSHERLEQSQWNLQTIFSRPYW